jgi:hypothetical protein
MKSFDPETRGYQWLAQTYTGIVRAGMLIVTWTLLAFVALAGAFIAATLVWSLLMLALRLIARI